MASTADQLARVQSLIERIENHGAAGYTENGTTWTYQNLDTLYKREAQLLNRSRAETSGMSFGLADPIDD